MMKMLVDCITLESMSDINLQPPDCKVIVFPYIPAVKFWDILLSTLFEDYETS